MSEPMSVATPLAKLTIALERLAAPAEQQISYLAELGVPGLLDELALEFDDYLRPLEWRMEGKPRWKELLNSLRRVDVALDSDLLSWKADSLESPEWAEIRRLAALSVELLAARKGDLRELDAN